jgi:hypothetical protein
MQTQSPWFASYKRLRDRDVEREQRRLNRSQMMGSLQRHLKNTVNSVKEDGFDRIEKCRMALRVLDQNGSDPTQPILVCLYSNN